VLIPPLSPLALQYKRWGELCPVQKVGCIEKCQNKPDLDGLASAQRVSLHNKVQSEVQSEYKVGVPYAAIRQNEVMRTT
jgi:hypothetical protein